MTKPDYSAPALALHLIVDGNVAPVLPGNLIAEIESAAAYAEASRAASTQRVYGSDWRIFVAWCETRAIEPLPADPRAVATFLAAGADKGAKPATIGRRLAAMGYHHKQAGMQPPQAREGAAVIRQVLGGIRRTKGVRPVRKRAADGDALRDILRAIEGEGLRAQRDRAVLVLGNGSSATEIEDCRPDARGHRALTPRIEDHQSRLKNGSGALRHGDRNSKRLEDPSEGVVARLYGGGGPLGGGPLFRKLTPADRLTDRPMSDRSIARLVQKHAAAAGYDPREFAGYSLRAGFPAEAEASGASIFKMQEVSRHKSVQALAAYAHNPEFFREHGGEKLL